MIHKLSLFDLFSLLFFTVFGLFLMYGVYMLVSHWEMSSLRQQLFY
jgi:hypothetical protein